MVAFDQVVGSAARAAWPGPRWAALALCAFALAANGRGGQAAPLADAFTYQGALRDAGQPANGAYDFQFELYPDAAGASAISLAPVVVEDVVVSNGVFSARVDFGFGQFHEHQAMFLEVRVRAGASAGPFTALLPRQELTPAPFALHAADVRDNSINASKIDANSVQARVTGSCPAGNPVLAVYGNGGVQCDDTGAGGAAESSSPTLDALGNVGQDLSMVVGADGTPRIAYYDATNGDLKYVRCRTPTCGIATRVTLDAGGIVGLAPSIANALDQNTFPGSIAVSYYDQTNTALKVARCSDADCDNVELRTIDAVGLVGSSSSVNTNVAGHIVTAYRDDSNQQLLYATCGNTGCIQVSGITVVDTAGNVGEGPVLSSDPNGRPVMVYEDVGANTLKFARCTSGTCSSAASSTIAAATLRGAPLALAFDASGYPLIAATDVAGTIHLVDCSNEACTAFTLRNLGVGPAGKLALAIGADGVPMIAYHYTTNQDLRFLRCRQADCSGGVAGVVEHTLANIGDLGSSLAMVVPPDGRPAIAYYDATGGDLEFFKCPNEWCLSYFGAK